jgi:hypothetical protein
MTEPAQHLQDDQQAVTASTTMALRTEPGAADVVPLIAACNRASKAHEKLYSRTKQATDEVGQADDEAAEADDTQDDREAEYEAIQAEDPHRRASRPRQWFIALAVLALDGVACYFAAEALGSGKQETLAWAGLFVALLGIGEIELDRYSEGHRLVWRCIAIALATFIVLLGVLRFSFLVVVGDEGLVAAAVGTTLFTIVTTGFVLIGYRALRLAETGQAWKARRRLRVQQSAAAAAHARHGRLTGRRDALARAYLSRIRLHLLEACSGAELAQAEQAVWAHLTGRDPR